MMIEDLKDEKIPGSYTLLILSDSPLITNNLKQKYRKDPLVTIIEISSADTLPSLLKDQDPVVLIGVSAPDTLSKACKLLHSLVPCAPFFFIAPDNNEALGELLLFGGVPLSYDGKIQEHLINALPDITRSAIRRYNDFLFQSLVKFFQIFLDMSRDPAFLMDLNGHMLGSNSYFEELVGKVRSEIVTCSIYDFYPKDLGTIFDLMIQKQQIDPENRIFLSHIRFTDEKKRLVLLNKLSRNTPSGQIDLIICLIVNSDPLPENEITLTGEEREYREIFEYSRDLIYIYSLDGILRSVNPAVEKNLGYSPEEVIGTSMLSFIHPDDHQRVIHEFNERISGEKNYNDEYCIRIKNKNGEYVPFEVKGVLRMRNGVAHDVLGFARDISARMRAEKEMKEQSALLSTTLESLDDIIFMHDEEGRYLPFIQSSLQDRLFFNPKEIFGKKFEDLSFPRDITDKYHAAYTRVLNTENPQSFDYSLMIQGELRYYNAKITLRKDETGRFIGTTDIIRDISDQVMVEKALRESENRLKTIIDNAPAVIFSFSREGILTLLGGKLLDDLSIIPARVIGSSMLKMAAFDKVLLKNVVNSLSGTGSECDLEYGGKRMRVLLKPLSGTDGVVLEIIGIATDVTGSYILEQALRIANKKLNLLSSITRHDILNMLGSIALFLDLAEQHCHDSRGPGYFQQARAGIDRIERIAIFTRMYQEIGIASPEWQNLEQLFLNVIPEVHPKEINIKTHVSEYEIYADPLCERVFYNLVENSIRHGKKVSLIIFSAKRVKDSLHLLYSDDGIGIPEKMKEKIFDRGYGENTGFGLFFIREVLSITGITIQEIGVSGEGVKFLLTIPPGVFRKQGKDSQE